MDYLTKFYKNQAEVLSEQIANLERQLKVLSEAEAPASTFSGSGAGQQRFSDLELQNQMRKHKRSGFLGAEVPDEKQSREYLEAKAELERRRGAAKPPVEQTGPKGSPSAVPTRTEVQRTQTVADRTQKPTALPTNVAPGTMHMTDMDGNPIAVQPKAPKMDPTEFAAHAAEAGGDYIKDKSGYIKSRFEPDYTGGGTKPTSTSAVGASDMVSRAFGIPSRAPGTMTTPSDIHGGRLQPGFHDGRIVPEVYADVQAAAPPGRWSGNWNTFIDSMRPKPISAPAAPADPAAVQSSVPASLYGTPPSAQFAPTTSSLETSSPAMGQAVKPSEIKNTPRPDQAAIDSAARQALPSPVKDVVKAGEDFSKFWAGKPRYGDLELQNMMRQHKRTGFMGSEIPLEKQPIEYRAARAELMRRGKLK